MRRSTLLAGLIALMLALAVAGTGGAAPRLGGTIVVTSYGSLWEEFMRKDILPPFEAETGVKVELAVGLSRDWVAKLRAAGKSDSPYDVLIANTIWLSIARKEGYYEKLTADRVPNLKDVWPEFHNKDDNGVIFAVNPIGIAYRRDLLNAPAPKRWRDLWNADYRGKLALYNSANSAGLMFLMMTAKVWANDEKNLDVAFQKVRELRPFRTTDFDMLGILARGEAAIAIIDAPQASRLKQQGLPIEFVVPLEGMFMFEQDTNVPVGSKNKAGASAFVNYMLSAPVQEKWVKSWFVTPANRKVKITNDMAQYIFVRTAPQVRSLIKWDWDWVNGGARDTMLDRWNREIVGR
jgi:putative spermidine/putrescine transport system substrate-binding protein